MKRERRPRRIGAVALVVMAVTAGGAVTAATFNIVNGIRFRDTSQTSLPISSMWNR
jgi:hypothetical protein